MRVAHLSNPKLLTDLIGRTQTEIARLQGQAATGKAFAAPSEDPFAATRSLQLGRSLDQLAQYEENAGRAEDRLTLQEVTFGDLGTLFQRVRELAIQGNSGVLSDSDRRAIATEVQALRDEAFALANAVDGEGNYLFAGYRTSVRPFADGPAGVTYLGDAGEREVPIGPGRRIVDGVDGDSAFMRIRAGNGVFVTAASPANRGTAVIDAGTVLEPTSGAFPRYTISFTSETDFEVRRGGTLVASGALDPQAETSSLLFDGVRVGISGTPAAGDRFELESSPNRSVFETLDELAEALRRPAVSPAERALLSNDLNSSLADIDQIQENLSTQRSRAGSRLNAVESQRRLNQDSALLLEASKATVEDVDLVETISNLQVELQSLEAAQRSFVAVQQLSLFNFL